MLRSRYARLTVTKMGVCLLLVPLLTSQSLSDPSDQASVLPFHQVLGLHRSAFGSHPPLCLYASLGVLGVPPLLLAETIVCWSGQTAKGPPVGPAPRRHQTQPAEHSNSSHKCYHHKATLLAAVCLVFSWTHGSNCMLLCHDIAQCPDRWHTDSDQNSGLACSVRRGIPQLGHALPHLATFTLCMLQDDSAEPLPTCSSAPSP